MSARIQQLRVAPLRIPFKVAFRHASAERVETASLWVEAVSERGTKGFGESCPRSYVTGETLETANAFFGRHEPAWRDGIVDLPSLTAWATDHAGEVDANPAAWCAVELAVLDLLAKESGQTVEELLGRPRLSGRFRYTAVLGDASLDAFRATAEGYRRLGFTDFKVKLSGDLARDSEKLSVLRQWKTPSPRVRIDANNLWAGGDEAVRFLRALEHPLFAVEEPLAPNQYVELARVGRALNCPIVLDESFLRLEQLAEIRDQPERWIINVRVSKMGGLLRSLKVVQAARVVGIGLIVGAQVGETSLLTRAALTVAAAAGNRLVAQEGAFGTFLLERDVVDPPLMFGKGGVLDVSDHDGLENPGFGLAPIDPLGARG